MSVTAPPFEQEAFEAGRIAKGVLATTGAPLRGFPKEEEPVRHRQRRAGALDLRAVDDRSRR
jgi:hypothetical protein